MLKFNVLMADRLLFTRKPKKKGIFFKMSEKASSQLQQHGQQNGNSGMNGSDATSSGLNGTPTTGPAVPLSSNLQPSVKIGHYVLGDTLGVGSFGKVKSKRWTLRFKGYLSGNTNHARPDDAFPII